MTPQEFAQDFIKRIPDAKIIHTPRTLANGLISPFGNFPQHCWVAHNGLCHDPDCPTGVETWNELPIFNNYRPIATSPCDIIVVNKEGSIIDYRLRAA